MTLLTRTQSRQAGSQLPTDTRLALAPGLAARCLAPLLALSLGMGQAGAALNDSGIDWWANGATNFLTSEPAGYPGQDASQGRDRFQDNDADGHAGFNFTKLDANGAALPAGATTWSCVRDNVTGLIWEVKTDDGGLHDGDDSYNWYDSNPETNGGFEGYANYSGAICSGYSAGDAATWCNTQAYVVRVNAQGWCGAKDWRLPTLDELRGIVDYSRSSPAIDTHYFPDTRSSWFWSASPHAHDSGYALIVVFDYGLGGGYGKKGNARVRLVRGGQALPADLPIPIRVTNALGLWVRSGPGTQYATLNEIDDAQEFVAFDRSTQGADTWYQIWLPCGNTGGEEGDCSGWVAGQVGGKTYTIASPTAPQVEVAGTAPLGLKIRAVPNGKVLDSAYDGQRFVSFESRFVAGSGCTSDWHRIHLPTSSYAASGWVCGDYAQLVGSVTSGTLQGRVTRAGSDLSGVTLNLGGAATGSAASGGDGGYAFTGLATGAYTLTPALANHVFSPASRAVTLAGTGRGGLDFRACDTTAALTGRVVDRTTQEGKVGVTVTVNGVPAAQTVGGGQFSIAAIGCGTFEIGVALAGYARYLATLDRFTASSLEIELTKESTTNGIAPDTGTYGDPVNTATGNYIYQRRDLEIPGIGLPFHYDRAYNSREASQAGAAGAPLGYGWTHSYRVRLVEDAGGIVTLTWGDGRTETYSPDGSGGYTPQYGVFDTLVDNGDGTFTLIKRDRSTHDFDASGRLVAITDKNGNRIALTYTGANLTGITDTAGRLITLDYDGSGRITLITDPLGRTVQYGYDGNGDLIQATDPNGNLTQYNYDDRHQILSIIDPRGHAIVNNSYDADRRVVTYQTDAKGNPTTYAYQELDRITTITDALGHVTVHQHDELLRLIREEDARGGIALYEYDGAGNRVRVTDKNGNATRYDYDARGNVIRKTDPLDGVTEITYDADDNPLSRTDALDQVTQFAYDANGNLIETTDALGKVSTIGYDGRGLPLTLTDPKGNVTNQAYDAEGNLIQVTNSLGQTTRYGYDGVGRRLTATDALGRTTHYDYDANDNLLRLTDALGGVVTHTYDGNDNKLSITDRLGRASHWAYDEKDLLISETDALGQVETYSYDPLDRRLSRTDRRGNTTRYIYDEVGNRVEEADALGNLTTFAYDLNGNQVRRTDAKGNATSTSYDAMNRLTQVQDALGNAVVTTYDALGRVLSLTAPGDRVTRNSYDALGRLTQTTDPEGGVTQFGYDDNGNRVSRTDANGHTTTTGFDALNRVVQVTDPLGHATQIAYDAVGNPVRTTDALGHAGEVTYDALNRPIGQTDALGYTSTTTYDAEGNALSTTDATGKTTSFGYDALNRLIQVTDAAGGTVQYSYDQNGNRLSMRDPNGHVTTYVYDALNRRITMTEPLGHVTSLVYDAVGNLIQKTDPKGQVIGYSYDAVNRRTGIDYPAQPDVSFSYDAVGNLISMTDGLGTTTHVYDLLDRRTGTTDPFGQQVGYGYDAVGNRIRLTYPGAKTITYAHDAANRLTSVTDWLGNQTRYSYDAANRLTGALNANGTTASYGYDAADRLTGLTNAKSDAGLINAYSYTLDPVGNHLSEDRAEPLSPVLTAATVTDAHDAENRLSHSNGVANSFDANGNLTAKGTDTYGWDANDRLIQTNIAGTQTQYQYDALGNRYRRTRAGSETRFVLDTNTSLTNVLMETDGAGTPLAYNIYGQGLISRILPDDSVLQYHYDSRGSTIAMTDVAQNVVRKYAYDPFGRVANADGSATNPFGFLGRHGVVDEGEDLSYIRARYYDAVHQRFVRKDSIEPLEKDGQTTNRYTYSVNNPITVIDINGYYGLKEFGSDAFGFTKKIGMTIAKETGKAVVSGAKFAWDTGYRTSHEVAGAIQGTIKSRLGGSGILAPIKKGVALWVAGKIVNVTLDVIEGDAEHNSICDGIYIIGPILCRYHRTADNNIDLMNIDESGNIWLDGKVVGIRRDGKTYYGQQYQEYVSGLNNGFIDHEVAGNRPYIPEQYEQIKLLKNKYQ